MQLPKIPKKSLKVFNNSFPFRSKMICGHPKQISPHVKAAMLLAVDEVAKKAAYAPDIFQMVYLNKMPMEKATEILGISTSYGYKLLKRELSKRGLSRK